MRLLNVLATALVRSRAVGSKLRWGARTVGVPATVLGTARLVALRLRCPDEAEVRLRSGLTLGFDVPSQVAPALVVFRELIDPEFAFLLLVSQERGVALDAGAAIGQFTVFAARQLGLEVHAYEPSGANVRTLTRNIERNGIAGAVHVHQVALSSVAGEARFLTASNTYMSRLDVASQSQAGATVPVRRLSDEVARLGLSRLQILKVNVAGFEPDVLAGADDLLARGGADILILLIGSDSIPWYSRLVDHGYRFFFFHPKEIRLHEVTQFDEASLRHSPWPARHLIGVHRGAISRGVLGQVPIAGPLGAQ